MVTRTDIANIALRLCGTQRIAAGALFTEKSLNASEIAGCYDIVRLYEMRRNVWRFSTRKVVVRAMDTNTMQVTFPAWAIGTTYGNDAIVLYSGQLWYSTVSSNVGQVPSDDNGAYWQRFFGTTWAALYTATTTYSAGEIVYVSSTAYLSLVNNNTATPPGANWRTLTSATLAPPNFIYPIGAGPISQSSTRNVFQLPNGWLRQAPDDPKEGSYHPLGAPSYSNTYNDFVFEGNYLISRTTSPLLLRACMDVADPNQFDPMFNMGFGAAIAKEVVERLTQSSAKVELIEARYDKIMGEARLVNGIEVGPVMMPEDEYIINRL